MPIAAVGTLLFQNLQPIILTEKAHDDHSDRQEYYTETHAVAYLAQAGTTWQEVRLMPWIDYSWYRWEFRVALRR